MTAAIFALTLLHESGVSSSSTALRDGIVRVTFTFSLEDVASLARLDADRNGVVEPGEWRRVLPSIFAYVGEHFRIDGCRSEGDPGVLPPAVRISDSRMPITLALRYLPSASLDRLKIRCDLFREHGGNPRHIAELPAGATVVFDNDRREAERPPDQAGLPGAWLAAALAISLSFLVRSAFRCWNRTCRPRARDAGASRRTDCTSAAA